MAMLTKYTASFHSVEGVHYKVDILADDPTIADATRVALTRDTPVEIEWNETDKLTPVQSSCLTLTLNSLKDRQFVNLYAVAPGTVRADVYRDGALYWSGVLDTELYEEPYSMAKDYDVTFSFSDFAVLDRKKWSRTGVCSIQDVIDTCITDSGISHRGIKQYISTSVAPEAGAIDLAALNVLCDNFYDEDGEPMTMREVLDEVLRPFALRMVQKGGYIHLYDLNAAYNDMSTLQVQWMADDASLGVDVTYNNVKVTFSPYADAKLIDATLDHDEVLPDRDATMQYTTDYDPDNVIDGFRIIVGSQDDLPLTLSNGAKFFRIDSDYSGTDEAGVMWKYKGSNTATYDKVWMNPDSLKAIVNGVCKSKPIITTPKAFLGYVSYKRLAFKLKITLDFLLDVRYNPFENASKHNEEGNWERLNDWCNFGYVPAMLYLKDNNGNILYHYENSGMLDTESYEHDANVCRWVEGSGSWGCMFLCYYDWSDRKSTTGFGGWQTNKPIIGYYRKSLPKKWEKAGEGEFIDLPPCGGFLELQIGSGVYQFDYNREEKDIYPLTRWVMYRNPAVTLVKSNCTDIQADDIETAAHINQEAKEELTIDTIIGTLERAWSPSARGLVMDSALSAHHSFHRAGVTDRLERLLIGTAYSQYATRHNTLTGTVRLMPHMNLCSDASSNEKYLIMSEVQNLIEDTSEITMTALSADNYEGLEYN